MTTNLLQSSADFGTAVARRPAQATSPSRQRQVNAVAVKSALPDFAA